MGSDDVETTANEQALLARFHCDEAFSVGPVGAVADNLQIGTWGYVPAVPDYQKGW